MPWKFGISLLVGILSPGLTNAAEENVFSITLNSPALSAGAFGHGSNSPVVPDAKKALKTFDTIILPDFGVPKVLPLRTVLSRLSDEISKIDPKRTGIVFLTSSRMGPDHPRIEDFLVRIDPPLKNVSLRGACEAILAVAVGPLEQDRTIKIACSFGNNAVSFREADIYPDELVRGQANDSNPSDDRLAAGTYLAAGIYIAEPFKGLVRVPEPTIDTLFVIQPRSNEFVRMPIIRPDPGLDLIPRSQISPQLLLDSVSR